MKKDWSCRVMQAADYQGVYALWLNTPGMGLNTTDDSEEGITAYLRRNPSTCFVAKAEEQIVGAILAGHDGRRGYIYHTAVAQEWRGRGIATELVQLVMDALDREGIQKAALVAFSSNSIGNAFWQAAGFTQRNDLVYRNRNLHPLEAVRRD